MKYIYDHEIQIPFEEKTFILQHPQIKLFQNLIDNYKVFWPELNLIYAFLNFNSKNPIDYLLIFTGQSNGEKIILWDAPYLYSNKTIPAYRYICKNNLYEQFFKFAEESLCRITFAKFKEFIPSTLCGLSLDKDNSKYWKNPENADILLEAMSDLALQYTPQPGQAGVKIIPHKKDNKK